VASPPCNYFPLEAQVRAAQDEAARQHRLRRAEHRRANRLHREVVVQRGIIKRLRAELGR